MVYYPKLEALRELLVSADDRADLDPMYVNKITVEFMMRVNHLIEEGA